MTLYYVDSSALVKRYLREIGTDWIMTLAAPAAGHTIFVAELTRVEAAAAIAARHRAPDGITISERDNAVNLLLQHCDSEYRIISLTSSIVSRAVTLTQNYRLRGYDAVQLASALAAAAQMVAVGLNAPSFIAADRDLRAAAQAEGLATDDPNDHP